MLSTTILACILTAQSDLFQYSVRHSLAGRHDYIQFSSDGTRALALAGDRFERINLSDGSLTAFAAPSAGKSALTVSASRDLSRALIGATDGSVYFLQESGSFHALRAHKGRVIAVAVSADGSIAASAGTDKRVLIWDLVNPDITIQQEKAIQLLLTGTTVAAAARELGIDRTTFYVWHKASPSFALALTRAREIQSQILTDSLQDLAAAAIDTLRDILVSPNAPPAVRLRAAQAVLTACSSNKHESQEEISTHFDTSDQELDAVTPPSLAESSKTMKTGRNEICPCNSGLKFKRCCGDPVRRNQQQAVAA